MSTALWDVMLSVTFELRTQYPNVQMYTKCRDKLVRTFQEIFEEDGASFAGAVSAKKFLERKDVVLTKIRLVLEEANPPRGSRSFQDPDGSRRRDLFHQQDGRCGICKQTLDPDRIDDGQYAHIDHKVPYARGGATEWENAALVHAECNRVKGASSVAEKKLL